MMPIYEITNDKIKPVAETRFEDVHIRERADLQRLLRAQIDIVCPGTLVIAEEFGDFDDSQRRIDLLGIDREANLVVIELKRSQRGEYMDLQALRYAAMVSTMTFAKATEVFGLYLAKQGLSAEVDPKAELLSFLEWNEPDEDKFAQDVRIVLVSADFSRELTTAVLWLNKRDLDIRCVRMKPYIDETKRVFVDVQQILPLPETEDYMIRLKEKTGKERTDRIVKSARGDLYRRFWSELLEKAKIKSDLHAGISPGDAGWIGASARSYSGLSFNYCFGFQRPRIELYICTGNTEVNEAIFDAIYHEKQSVEEAFGDLLTWERLEGKRTCRVKHELSPATIHDEEEWDTIQDVMIDKMIRLEAALRDVLKRLRLNGNGSVGLDSN